MEHIKLIQIDGNEKYVNGYFLTMKQMVKLLGDYQADSHDGFVSNDEAYISLWLQDKKNDITNIK